MIIQLKKQISPTVTESIAAKYDGFIIRKDEGTLIVTPSAIKKPDSEDETHIDRFIPFDNDIQLASRNFQNEKRQIQLDDITIGGRDNHTYMIAGPCSVESKEQLNDTALFLKETGVKILRAGCYKPRTSPYSFQGLGLEGLKILAGARDNYGLKIITEVRDATHIDEVIEYTDIIQVGAKAMYDQGILRRCAKADKPVLIKRGFGSTLQEFVQAAEFVLSGGNDDVILCERGIRTFETHTRFTLDLCGAAFLKEYTNLPVVLDPSHAMGKAYGVPDLTRACLAMGIEGLLIEVHPRPAEALSDASQQLDFNQFSSLYNSLKQLAPSVGRTLH